MMDWGDASGAVVRLPDCTVLLYVLCRLYVCMCYMLSNVLRILVYVLYVVLLLFCLSLASYDDVNNNNLLKMISVSFTV